MNTLEAIARRYCVREYKKAPISESDLSVLCHAGLMAPSANNKQPWEMIVVCWPETLLKLSGIRAPWIALKSAGAAIVIASLADKYLEQNCAAAAENILLAAVDVGLCACWLGLYPNMENVREVSELLNLPPDLIPVIVISLGWPVSDTTQRSKVPLEGRVHFERFERKLDSA